MSQAQTSVPQTFAETAVPGTPPRPQRPPEWMNYVPMAVIFAVFYFLFIRPQGKQMKEHKALLEGLKKGDRVLTEGGFYGTIVGLKGVDLEIKIAEGVKMQITRQSVRRLADAESAQTPVLNGEKTV